MKQIVLKNGLWSSLVVMGPGIAMLVIAGVPQPGDYALGEVVGYASIVLAMVFVVLGIRQYRDQVNEGVLSFPDALKVGSLITFVPSLLFGIYNLIYVEIIDPEFMEKYYQYQLDQQKASLSPQEYEVYFQQMEAEKAMFTNHFTQFVLMFLTVFVIGFIVTVVSSFFLKKRSK